MNAAESKTGHLYDEVRRRLTSGHYLPGQRIDPNSLAKEFGMSPTPVRCALYRLVGEGLITDHARAGLQVPLPNEVGLRDLYDWMSLLLATACNLGLEAAAHDETTHEVTGHGTDTAGRTWTLFDAIARAAGQQSLHQAVRTANDRLAPIRRAKRALVEDRVTELDTLVSLWEARDLPALQTALQAYHRRRRNLVPQIIALLEQRSDRAS